ncbi:hypothetical protein [Nitrospira sp. BLG_2]|uniref:hypothetical protein n=1 Tax=Nitrospira sp. BLG_2 TaxID=3397507 RepID=UPI003B9D5E92
MLYHLFQIAIILVAIWVIPQIIFWVGGVLFIIFAAIYAAVGLFFQQIFQACREATQEMREDKAKAAAAKLAAEQVVKDE